LLTLLVVVSFCVGLTFHEVTAAVGPVLVAQGGLPEAIARVRPSLRSNLQPLDTYHRVLTQLKEHYYRDLPDDKKLTYSAIKGMLLSLDDIYTRFLDPEQFKSMDEENQGEFVGIGAQLSTQLTEDGYTRISWPLPDTPASRAGIQAGDVIVRVNGTSIQNKQVDDVVKMIRGPIDTPVKLTIRRKAPKEKPDDPDRMQTLDISIKRRPVSFPIVQEKILEGNVGYVSLQQFNEMCDEKLDEVLREFEKQGVKGLILDLRANPGGLLQAAQEIASRFVPESKEVVWIEEKGQKNALKSIVNRRRVNVPFIILVNRNSASASEIVAGAVKDWGTGTVVGTTTFGKGLVQTVVPLSDRSAVVITTARYLTPKLRDINRSLETRGGIDPDVEVTVTEEQYYALDDVQLKKALELMHTRIGYQKPAGDAAARVPGE
jgi:carboxyl-terminal processing protease